MPWTGSSIDSSTLAHATIKLFEPGDRPGFPGAQRGTIDFQFNPKELVLSKAGRWEHKAQKGGSKTGPQSYLGPDPQQMSLELFFDASGHEQRSANHVVENVERLFAATTPTDDSKNKPSGASAPWVQFMWGTLSGFVGYISKVSAKYTLFDASGKPLRAVCTVTLQELGDDKGKQNPTSGGLLPRRVHTLVEGDSLPSLAYREYGDAALWRPLAEVNGIDDPMRLKVGHPIYLPTSAELARDDRRAVARAEVSRADH